MITSNNETDALSILNEFSERMKDRPKVDWRQLFKKVSDEMIAIESKKHTTEIVNEFKKVGLAGPGSGLFNTLKNLNKIDEDRTRLIESILAYSPCPERMTIP